MASIPFASIESTLAATSVATFENIRLIAGAVPFGTVMDRDVDMIGEYGLSGERRDRITLLKSVSAAAGLAGGVTVSPDPAYYSAGEIAAMVPSSWVVDRLAVDDGHVVSWWLR